MADDLAARLLAHAKLHDEFASQDDDEQVAWAADLRAAAALLAAAQQPGEAQEAVATLADELEKQYGHHFTTTRDGMVSGEHFDFERHPLVGRAVKLLRAAPPARQPVASWVHEDDPDRVISATQKSQALRDGGASASSLRPYSVPTFANASAPPARQQEARDEALRASHKALTVIAAELAQRAPLDALSHLEGASHIGHRQFGRAYAKADECVRKLAVRVRDAADKVSAALTTPAPEQEGSCSNCDGNRRA